MKKSFILYNDSLDVLDDLNDQQTAELFRAIRDYQNGKEVKISGLMNAIFNLFKNQFVRDSTKYEAISERNRANGKKGGRPKSTENQEDKEKPKNPKEPSGFFNNPKNPNKPDNDNDNDNETGTDNETVNVTETKKNNIEERKLKFASTLEPFIDKFGKSMIRDFFEYWTEPNKSNTKFKQEAEKHWSLSRRLSTWDKNQNKFVKEKSSAKKENEEEMIGRSKVSDLQKNMEGWNW